MRKAELIKKMIPIYLASCLAWIHNIAGETTLISSNMSAGKIPAFL